MPTPAELRGSCAFLQVGVVSVKLRAFTVWTKRPGAQAWSHSHPDGQLMTDKCETPCRGFGFQLYEAASQNPQPLSMEAVTGW